METLRFVVIFLVCYYVTKKASNLLPNRLRWLYFLQIFFVINLIWLFLTLAFAIVEYQILKHDYSELCHTSVFITTRFGGELATFLFAIIGGVISFHIKKMPRKTSYDIRILEK